MKYYRLHIDSKSDFILYKKITQILNIEPAEEDDETYSLWTYAYEEDENDSYYDFINKFLDIIEPNVSKLQEIGIYKEDITFWMVYEYEHQCGMEFHPQEMKRLGESGIVMCIDCFKK